MRIAIFTSHPIQYQAPWFRALAVDPEVRIRVFFSHVPDAIEQGVGFGRPIVWDIPLRDGYDSLVFDAVRVSEKSGFFRRLARRVGAALDDMKPDAAMIMGWHEAPLLQAFLACVRRRVPIILRGDSNALRARPAPVAFIHRTYCSLASSALAVGNANADLYRNAGMSDDRIIMARHFVDNERFATSADALRDRRNEVRAEWGIATDAFCALFAGKLEPKKRVHDLLEATRSARDGGARVHALVVGSGEQQEAAKSFAAAHSLPVTFAGFLNQSEITRAYVAADALVLPSDYGETWGLVVNEAMATGAPAIVSDRVGCANDLVVDGVTGAVVPFADPATIAERLALWARRPEIARTLGAAARRHVHSEYTINRASAGLKQATALGMRMRPARSPGATG
jgi:glycosyltransferase involved in cell wall biosynthesis